METAQVKNCVLNADDIDRKLRRIGLELIEHNPGERNLIIAAINGNGEVVGRKLANEIKRQIGIEIDFAIISINKKDPVNATVSTDLHVDNKVIVVVDDVANSGRTMMYALKPFLAYNPKKIQTVALVERSHKRFPVHLDFTGLSIATTLHEHIVVETEEGEITGAWLY